MTITGTSLVTQLSPVAVADAVGEADCLYA